MSLLVDQTIREFNDLLGSSEPAPGGGSTAALAGLLAASLTRMVANLSFGKKGFEELEEDKKNEFKKQFEKVSQLNKSLTGLVDKDTEAFTLYMEAMKMPKNTEEEKSKRAECLRKAGLYAMEIPLEVGSCCISVLRNQAIIAQFGNKNAISDIGVGALLAWAGLEGAVLNAKINLPGISDEFIKKEAQKTIQAYQEEALKLKTEILAIVEGRL